MFELPQAKRVRREDLDASGASSESDGESGDEQHTELRTKLNARIGHLLGLKPPSQENGVSLSDAPAVKGAETSEDGMAEDEHMFRLFNTSITPTKVILEDDAKLQGNGGIVAQRPLSYYITTDISEESRNQYAFAATSGEEVMARSEQKCWGLEQPWRVLHVPSQTKSTKGSASPTMVQDGSQDDGVVKRKRAGKKKRIALRKRARAKTNAAALAVKKQQEKEEHVLDKKKRMNRLKKLRKRAKNREMKLGVGEGGGDGDKQEDLDSSGA